MSTEIDKNLKVIMEYFDCCSDRWSELYQKDNNLWYVYNTISLREKYAIDMVKGENLGVAVDLGCGTGQALIRMIRLGFAKVIGIDISSKMLEKAQKLVDDNKLSKNISLYAGDVQKLPMIASGTVDVCVALGIIEYQMNDEPFLREINRILKQGGAAVIQVRNHDCLRLRTLEWLYFLNKKEIFYREHGLDKFVNLVKRHGFIIEGEIYSHFYAFYPFDLIPYVRKLIWPFDNFLSKKLEIFFKNRFSRWLASMYIVKVRKVREY